MLRFLVLFVLATGIAEVAEASVRTRHPDFAITPGLQLQVDFWKRIYGEYGTNQSLIHDSRYVQVVYEVVTRSETESPRAFSRRTAEARKKWRQVLLSLHRRQSVSRTETLDLSDLSSDELRVFELFSKIQDPGKYLAAAHRRRLRSQLGQKDRFREGLVASGRYLPELERLFDERKLPWELTRLPFVESSFNLRARSKVGASGIWQFMRSTGRLYLKINSVVDERNDPLIAGRGAADLFAANHEALGNWPLAVTAYNHGRMGLLRAVRQVGSSRLEDLIWSYRSRSFGFASSNFFACLLAALEVEGEAEKYFGKVERDPPLSYEPVELPRPARLRDLAWYFEWNLDQMRALNPGISDSMWKGQQRLPAGFRLRLPLKEGDGQGQLFHAGFEKLEQALTGRKSRVMRQ